MTKYTLINSKRVIGIVFKLNLRIVFF